MSGMPHGLLPAVEKSYWIPYMRGMVYAAWVSSSTIIAPATSMRVSAVVGGHYTLHIDGPDGRWKADGIFDIVEPNARLRYSWQWDGDSDRTLIDVQFADENRGTRVMLTHSGFANPENRVRHDSGWDDYIEGFAAHLAAKS